MEIESILSDRINLPDIRRIAAWACEAEENRERLFELAGSDDRRTSVNAMWALTHLAPSEAGWFASRQSDIIGMLLGETDEAKKRLLLKLLREQEYGPENIPIDFLDYCLAKINSECEPYAVRASCIHLAFKMCRHYPELVAELEERLAMLGLQTLSPGLLSACRNTQKAIRKLKQR